MPLIFTWPSFRIIYVEMNGIKNTSFTCAKVTFWIQIIHSHQSLKIILSYPRFRGEMLTITSNANVRQCSWMRNLIFIKNKDIQSKKLTKVTRLTRGDKITDISRKMKTQEIL